MKVFEVMQYWGQYEPSNVDWFVTLEEAVAAQDKALVQKATLTEVEIPTDAKSLVEWLNENCHIR